MPDRKASEPHQRAKIMQKRNKARNTHYKIMTTVKEHNQNNKPIGFKQLCTLADHHKVSRFIRDAEAWGMITSHYGTTDRNTAGILLTITSVGDAFIKYCCEQGNTKNPVQNRNVSYNET